MEPETTETETGTTEQPVQNQKLIVEQEDVDKVLSFPIFGQVENVEKNTGEILTELQKLNEFLIPNEEELKAQEEQAAKDAADQADLEALQLQEEEDAAAEEVEEEIVVDYDPLILEQLETLNAHMEESLQTQNDIKLISAEGGFLIALTIVVALGVNVFIGQITKW